jgi:hypothetical protein
VCTHGSRCDLDRWQGPRGVAIMMNSWLGTWCQSINRRSKNLIPRYLIIRTLFTFHSVSYATINATVVYSIFTRRRVAAELSSFMRKKDFLVATLLNPSPPLPPKLEVSNFAPKYYVGREGGWGVERPNLCSENKGHKFRYFDFAPKYYAWGKA